MKKLMLTETLNCGSELNYGWRKFGGAMISSAESPPPIFVIDVPGVNCAQLFAIAELPPSESLNHSAVIAPSGKRLSFIDLRGDDVVAQSGGGRSFVGKPQKKINITNQ